MCAIYISVRSSCLTDIFKSYKMILFNLKKNTMFQNVKDVCQEQPPWIYWIWIGVNELPNQ